MPHPRWLLAQAWRRALTARRGRTRKRRRPRWLRRPSTALLTSSRPNRHPLVMYLYLILAISGTSSMYRLLVPGYQEGDPATRPAIELLPEWLRGAWYVMLLIGGGISLVAVARRDELESLLVERLALTLLGPASLIWSVVLCTTDNPYSSLITMLFGVACGLRWWKIRSELHAVIAARVTLMQAQTTEERENDR